MKTHAPRSWPLQRTGRLTPCWLSSLCVALLLTLPARGQNAPVVVEEPEDAVISLGGDASFKVRATATGPAWLEWYLTEGESNTLLLGTNNNARLGVTLTLTNLQAADAGGYYAVITNDWGTATSRIAQVIVDPTFMKLGQTQIGDDGFLGTPQDVWVWPNWVDYDRDGWLDVFKISARGTGLPLQLYRSNRDGSFTRVNNRLTEIPGHWEWHAWADFDGDGDLDCLVDQTPPRTGYLFLNQASQGIQDFTPISLPFVRGLSLSRADYDADGWVDVAITPWPGVGSGAVPGALLRNVGGQFHSVPGTPFSQGMPHVEWHHWVDYDGDGDLDFHAVTSPFGDSAEADLLFQNQGDGTFERLTGHVLTEPRTANIMAGWGDYDNDGDLDVFLPYWERKLSVLYRNDGNGEFTADPNAPVLDMTRGPVSPSWGDYDNDGDLDLVVTHEFDRSRLFVNDGTGRLTEVWVGCPTGPASFKTYQCFWADYDNDGFLDLLACIVNGRSALYRNQLPQNGNQNHWLKVDLRGTASNPHGLGAKLRVQATLNGQPVWQMRQIGILNGDVDIAHFGLGDATEVEVLRVEWPSGNVQELSNLAANQSLTLTEPAIISPARPSASLGGSVTLRAQTRGIMQWYHEGVTLEGQTRSTLVLTNLTPEQVGRYSVVVQNVTGTATHYVYLNVDPRFEVINSGDVVLQQASSSQGVWGDYDGDSHLDLAVTGGYWDTSGAVNTHLYRNDGAGNLIRVTDGPLATSQDRCAFLAWADYDNDGDLDLITGVYENTLTALYLNQGDGQFVRQRLSADWIANGIGVRGSTIAWGDYDADGYLDLMVANWVASGGPVGSNALLRNLGEGRFAVVTNSVLALPGTSEETVAWVDFDGDGKLDFSSVESASSQIRRLFRNLGQGEFEPVTDSPFWGERKNYLGHAWADFDNDGDLDVVVCSSGASDGFFLNDGHGHLTRIDPATMGLPRNLGNHPAWGDFDNDGWLDLFCSNGSQPNRLYRNRGDGTFEEILVGSIATDVGDSWIGAWGDYDGDGYLDLFIANDSGSPNTLYRNNHRAYLAQRGRTHHWLQINLQGTTSNRSGVGAKIHLTAVIDGLTVRQMRQIGGQTDAPELFAHFGLGDASTVDRVRIEWPSGIVQELTGLDANKLLTVTEPPRLLPLTPRGFQIQCWLNQSFDIQTSTDLTDWTHLTTVTNITGTLEFHEPENSNDDCRYYRVVAQ